MKGVFVMNTSLHDILFMTMDNELRIHYHQVAVKQELCQAVSSDKQDGIDIDVMVQLLAPLLNSQHFLIEELKTAYRSITCQNGFVFVFAEFFGHVFLAVNGDRSETEEFMFRKMAVLHRIIGFTFGPAVKELKPRVLTEKLETWKFIGQLLNMWCELYNSQQSFLCEAIEQLNLADNLSSKCVEMLDAVLEMIKKLTGANVEHVALIANSKILTLFSSVEALSAVFTSDKLLLTVLVNVLHSTHGKVANTDSCSASVVQTNGSCSGANQHFSKADKKLWRQNKKLWRQKSATMPAKRSCASCNARRLSEPLISNVGQTRTSQTLPDTNSSQVDRMQKYTSAAIENSQLDGAVSKPSSLKSNAALLSSRVPSQGYVVTTMCSKEPLVVNPVYGSDDCSTLKSLSFETKASCSRECTSALSRMLHVTENTSDSSISDQHTSSSLAQEDKFCATVNMMPGFSDSVAEENVTFSEVPADENRLTASSCGDTDVSCRVTETDREVHDVCSRYRYSKVCVYLQEGSWRHSPHSLHCIRINDNISLLVLCELIYKSHAKLLSRLMDLIFMVTSGKWKMSISLPIHIEGAIDTCMKSVMLLPASYKELENNSIISQYVSELCGYWEQAKCEEFIKKLDASRDSSCDLDERLLRLLRDMYNHTIELFRVLFYQPRFMSSDVEHLWKLAMADARRYIYTRLCGANSYIDVIANSSMCSSSFLQRFPNVVHFVYVDRKVNLMIAPILCDFASLPKRKMWNMFERMRAALLNGYCVSIIHSIKLCFSYSLCIEDVRGKQLPLKVSTSTESPYTLPGTLCQAFYRHLMKSCCHPSMQPARCYELFVVYAQPVSDSFVRRQNRTLVSEVINLFDSIQSPPPFLMF